MKRLGIFIITEVNGIVDDYIMFFLNEFKKVLDDLIIVCISSNEFNDSILREHTKNICYLSDSTTYGQGRYSGQSIGRGVHEQSQVGDAGET